MTNPEVFDFAKSTVITGVRSPEVCEDETDFAIVKVPKRDTGEETVCLVTKSRHQGMEDVVVDRNTLEAVAAYAGDEHDGVVDVDVYDPRMRKGLLKPLLEVTVQELHAEAEHVEVDLEGLTVPEHYLSLSGLSAATHA